MPHSPKVNLYLEPEVMEALKIAATADVRTINSLVKKLVFDYLKANNYLT